MSLKLKNYFLILLSLSIFCVVLIQGIILPVRMKYDSEKHKMAMLIVFGVMAAVVGGAFALAEACGVDLDAVFDSILIAHKIIYIFMIHI